MIYFTIFIDVMQKITLFFDKIEGIKNDDELKDEIKNKNGYLVSASDR